MADNGHCSSCQVQNSPSLCGANVQTFKKIIGSLKVENQENYLKLNLNNVFNISKSSTVLTENLWNQFYNVLQYIRDYGVKGNLNPTQEKINNTKVNQNDFLLLNNYNNILKAIDENEINGTQFLSKELIDSLITKIKNYQIDDIRCDTCNLAGCEVTQHCVCDCDCDCNCTDCECFCDCGCGLGDNECGCTGISDCDWGD